MYYLCIYYASVYIYYVYYTTHTIYICIFFVYMYIVNMYNTNLAAA